MASSSLSHLRSLLLLLLLLHVLPAVLAISTSDCNITLGSSLSAGDNNPLGQSPSGEFAFGFLRLGGPQADEDLFLLAIWLAKIPELTVVWSRNENPVPRKSKITLTNGGELILYDSKNTELWKASSSSTNNNKPTCAAMLDSGIQTCKNKRE
ncbi:unnamed protein product [Ilex paraguariensis]|uniref:Bulb-type lectin domain-containing protein n=1 Tax=Ilex paraguariensis TaxID=185542 RepID=A0ABC8RV20_9AQUA